MIRITLIESNGELGASFRFERASREWIELVGGASGELLVEVLYGEKVIAASICLHCDLAAWKPDKDVLPRPAAGTRHSLILSPSGEPINPAPARKEHLTVC